MQRSFVAIILLGISFIPSIVKADVRFRTPVPWYVSAKPIYNYKDDNPAAGAISDWRCGKLTYDKHGGTDFNASMMTPVYAAASGQLYHRVDACDNTGWIGNLCGGGFGNHVRIAHVAPYNDFSPLVTIYAHFLGNYTNVRGLSSVTCGSWIGYSGSSGNSDAPHVHFELWRYAKSDDPFAGACGGPISYWVNQNGGLPTTQCQ